MDIKNNRQFIQQTINGAENIIFCKIGEHGVVGGYNQIERLYLPEELMINEFTKFTNTNLDVEHDINNVVGKVIEIFRNTNGYYLPSGEFVAPDFCWTGKFLLDTNKITLQEALTFKGVSTWYRLLQTGESGVYNGIEYDAKVEAIEPVSITLTNSPRYDNAIEIKNSIDMQEKEEIKNADFLDEIKNMCSEIKNQYDEIKNMCSEIKNEEDSTHEAQEAGELAEMKTMLQKLLSYFEEVNESKEENIQNESEDKKDLDIKNSVKSMKKLKISWVNEDNIQNSLDNNQDHKKKEYIF